MQKNTNSSSNIALFALQLLYYLLIYWRMLLVFNVWNSLVRLDSRSVLYRQKGLINENVVVYL